MLMFLDAISLTGGGVHCVSYRQMVARSLLDTLKAVSEDERDCIAVLERVSKLADDSGKLPFNVNYHAFLFTTSVHLPTVIMDVL